MRQSISIGFVVTLQLLATIATQLVIIRIIGIGTETDAYIAAQTAPAVLTAIIVTALQSAWLPRLSVLTGNISVWKNEQSIAQGQGLLLGGGIVIIVYLLLPVLIPLIFPGFDGGQEQRVILFSMPLLLAAVFNIQTALLTIALRARSQFIVAEFITMFAAIIALIVIVKVLPEYGLEAVLIINLIRSICVYLMQMYFAKWPMPSLIKAWRCKQTWKMMRPLLLGASLYKTSPLVDRYWLSQATSGGVTIYSLSQTIMSMLSTVLERVIAMPLTPSFARYIESNDFKGLRKAYRQGIKKVTITVVLIAALMFLLKPLIIVALVSLLNLKQIMAENIWWVSVFLLGYLHVAVSGTIAVAVFYAFGDSKTPVTIGIVGFIGSLFLKFVGFELFSLYGLALATSAYYVTNILIMNIVLRRKICGEIS